MANGEWRIANGATADSRKVLFPIAYCLLPIPYSPFAMRYSPLPPYGASKARNSSALAISLAVLPV
jgi:hypothetical protein